MNNPRIRDYIEKSLTAYHAGKFSAKETLSQCGGYLAACYEFGHIDEIDLILLTDVIAKTMCDINKKKKN